MEKPPQPQPKIEPPRVEKIAESSPTYQENRYSNEYYHDDKKNLDCFGNFVFDMIKHIREKAIPVEERLQKFSHSPVIQESIRDVYERLHITPDEASAGIHEVVLKNIELFRKLMLDKNYTVSTNNFLYEATQNPEIITALRQEKQSISKSTIRRHRKLKDEQDPISRWANRTFGSDPSVDSLIALVGAKKISDELWLKILNNHEANFKEYLREFREQKLPALLEQFQNTIEAAIDRDELPLSKDLVKKRLGQTHVTLKDALHSALEKNRGRFNPETDVVSVDSFIAHPARKKQLEYTFFHEMFHALSGRLITKEVNEEDDELGEIRHERIGLHFNISREEHQKLQRFRWLNEAITTRLEDKYVPPPEKTPERSYLSYEKERELLELIMTKGKAPIDEKFFTAAYFENLDPTLPPEKRLPAWKTLSQQLEQSWGKGFLNRVDASIKKIGLVKTIEAIK
ncbi:MAG: hypothetical protein Q7K35_05450 [bacterium]|nr:hypothetical protein [bacterium]